MPIAIGTRGFYSTLNFTTCRIKDAQNYQFSIFNLKLAIIKCCYLYSLGSKVKGSEEMIFIWEKCRLLGLIRTLKF